LIGKAYLRGEQMLKLSVELPQNTEIIRKLTGIYQNFPETVLFFLFSSYPLRA